MESWRLLPLDAGVGLPAWPARKAHGRRVRTDAKVSALLSLPPLRGASDRELELIARVGDQLDLPAESVLLDESERVEWVYLLMEGSAFAVAPRWRFGPGDVIGALGYLAGEPGHMTVVAGTAVRVLTIGVNRFSALLEEAPSLRRAVILSLARQLGETLRHHAGQHPGCDGGSPPLLRAS